MPEIYIFGRKTKANYKSLLLVNKYKTKQNEKTNK